MKVSIADIVVGLLVGAFLCILILLVSGCTQAVAPELRGITARNEYGLYSVKLHAHVDGEQRLRWDFGDGASGRLICPYLVYSLMLSTLFC